VSNYPINQNIERCAGTLAARGAATDHAATVAQRGRVRRTILAATIAAAVGALALAGCGGGSSPRPRGTQNVGYRSPSYASPGTSYSNPPTSYSSDGSNTNWTSSSGTPSTGKGPSDQGAFDQNVMNQQYRGFVQNENALNGCGDGAWSDSGC
jgi:hypothetical protein